MKIIAYGSLMNQSSLECTLGRAAKLTPITVNGYRRTFNAEFDGYAFLNLRPDPLSAFAAAWFDLSPAETIKFSEREAGSDLVEITPSYTAYIWPPAACAELSVLRSYVEFCDQAARALGIDFWQGTDLPDSILEDVNLPLYAGID